MDARDLGDTALLAGPGSRILLAGHLDTVPAQDNRPGRRVDEKLKKLLATKCGGDKAPAGLRERLRAQIRVTVLEQVAVTVQSGPDGTTAAVVERRSTRIQRNT